MAAAMALPQAVSEHYQAQQRLILATLGMTRREWSRVNLNDIDASWSKVAPRLNLLTSAAQLGSARNGAAYVGRALSEVGQDVAPLAAVNPAAFAGVASDGRRLESLLEGAKIHAKQAQSLEAGGKWLDMAIHTQIADAGRGAASVAILARPGIGYVRMVNPPCCSRCAVLAGKWFRSNHGFQRHPRCDCTHIPTGQDAADQFTSEPHLNQIRGLSAGERKALEQGADLGQVVNARRGASGMTTTEGTSRTGMAYRRLQGRRRLTPDAIFKVAPDESSALRLLSENGYLTPVARRAQVLPIRPTVPVREVAAPQFGKVIEAPDGKTAPLKGHGPGRPLTYDEYENAPSVRADSDYRMISDPDDRATAILQYYCETEQWAKRAARNVRAGADPLEGIDFHEVSWSGREIAEEFLGDGYVLDDLKADIRATAQKLVEWESKAEDLGLTYKGINFDPDLSWDQVVAKLDMRGLSHTSVSHELSTARLYAGRADRSKSVVVEFTDAKGIRLDSVGNHASKTESLVSGDFEVVSTRIEPDPDGYGERMIVEARRAQ